MPVTPGSVVAALAADAGVDENAEPYGGIIFGQSGFLTPADVAGWIDLPAEGWIGDGLTSLVLTECSDRELLDAAAAWERLSAWVAGNQACVIAEFTKRRPPDPEDAEDDGRYLHRGAEPPDPNVAESATDELAVALTLSQRTAADRMHFARTLALILPATLEEMCAGRLSTAKAHVLVDQSCQLTAEQAALLEQRVLPGAAAKTRAQFYQRVRREITRIDADALRRREKQAAADREVTLVPLPDGMAELRCTLPGADAVAGYNWLDQQARTAKAAGDGRTLDQLRADAFVDLICHRSTAVARKPLIQVLVPASTLAGGDIAGELAGFGPINADLARQLAADGTWQRLLTDPATGAITDIGTRRYVPSAPLRRFVHARDRTCRFPTCNQPACRCEIDHTRPYSRSRRTHPDNLGALCRRHHRLKDKPGNGWELERTEDGRSVWTTPTGRVYEKPPDAPVAPTPAPEPEPPVDDEPPPF